MHTMFKLAVVTLAFTSAAGAGASTITIGTAHSSLGPQASAAAYQAVVDAALFSGAQFSNIVSYDNVSAQSLLGSDSNYAFKSTVNFGVSAANAGTWEIRSGVDFGFGGAIYVDGVAYDYKSNNMWWAGNYNDASQYFDVSLKLAPGNHTMAIYGLEDCCSGNYQAQFKIGQGSFASFAATDGLIAASVPEPQSYAMMLAGLGLVGWVSRRKARKA